LTTAFAPLTPPDALKPSGIWHYFDHARQAIIAHAHELYDPEWRDPEVSQYAAIQETERQLLIIRDILGDPLQLTPVDPPWLSETAVLIARGMYETQDFFPMPILADALQDAGCDSDDVLSHCRDARQVHVRGCWVVDLVLGKE
jgi:hypothetical protein